jgi:hydrogenase maturation protease
MPNPCNILIAGVGNELLTDDGVGIHAVRVLQQQAIDGVTAADLGTAVLHGLHFLESAERVLVIDAARGGQPPGTIYLFEAAEPAETKAIASVHAMGLIEAGRLLLLGKPVPPITVIGVEPASLAYGMTLSGAVQDAFPRVVSLARKIVAGWLPPARHTSRRSYAFPLPAVSIA